MEPSFLGIIDRQKMKRTFLLCAGLVGLVCCGCPDYSHLRDVPDYDNMSDGGVDENGVEQENSDELQE